LGIKIQGRTRSLDHVYRSTRELTRFAQRFAGQSQDVTDPQQDLFPGSSEYSGPEPELRKLADLPGLIGYVSDTVVDLMDKGYSSSEIAVVYLSKEVPGQEQPLPALIQTALNQRGVLSTWLSQDVRSKATYDITTDIVTISTAHSVKGLDYAAVIVLGLDMVEPGDRWNAEQLERIAYVAVTRARYRLYVPYMDASPLIRKLIKTADQ
jgi:superfamily I DNA/RNA helicase